MANFSSEVSARRLESRFRPRYGSQEVIKEPRCVGGREVAVAVEGKLILGFAGDLPLGGGQRLVLTHGQAGPRFAGIRRIGSEILGTDPAEDLELLRRRLGAVQVKEDVPEALADRNGSIGGGVDAAGNGRSRSGRA